MRESSSTAVRVWVSACVVDSAAVETPVMFVAISLVPPAASCTERDISLVVAVCSSTAEAMVVCRSEICATIELISSIAVTAAPVSSWIACTRRAMSSVALAVSWASSLTSLATTAKPLPASPARAASIVALSASRFVCSAMLVMVFTTSPISWDEAPSAVTVRVVVPAASTAVPATRAASAAFCAISLIDAPISFRTGGHGLHVPRDLLGGHRNGAGLGGRLLGARADCLGRAGQLLRRRGQCMRGLGRRLDGRPQALGGLVQRTGHVADLVGGGDLHARREVTGGHRHQTVADGGHRADDQPGDEQPQAHREGHAQDEDEEDGRPGGLVGVGRGLHGLLGGRGLRGQ